MEQFTNVGMRALPLLLIGSAVAACLHQAPARETSNQVPQGCYRFDRPLGASATGELERNDSSSHDLQLADSGVARSQLSTDSPRERGLRRSGWREERDTLYVRLFNGLVGWDLTLIADSIGLHGVAGYLTDVVVKDWVQPQYPVRGRRRPCP